MREHTPPHTIEKVTSEIFFFSFFSVLWYFRQFFRTSDGITGSRKPSQRREVCQRPILVQLGFIKEFEIYQHLILVCWRTLSDGHTLEHNVHRRRGTGHCRDCPKESGNPRVAATRLRDVCHPVQDSSAAVVEPMFDNGCPSISGPCRIFAAASTTLAAGFPSTSAWPTSRRHSLAMSVIRSFAVSRMNRFENGSPCLAGTTARCSLPSGRISRPPKIRRS